MPKCQCGVELPARRRKCDDCKKRPGQVVATDPAKPAYPDGLGDRGRVVWSAIGQHLDTPAGQLALEACRLADRLDEMDRVIAGKGVLNLMQFRLHLDLVELLEEGLVTGEERRVKITVEVSRVLSEARQMQVAFKTLLEKLAELKVKTSKDPAPATGSTATPASNGLDELEQRRLQREQGT